MTKTLPRTHSLDKQLTAIAAHIKDNALTRQRLNAAMAEIHRSDDETSIWTQRYSFDVMEAALCRAVLTTRNALSHAEILQMAAALPTQTVRSEEQIALQQFSTPIDLASLVVRAGRPVAEDRIYEPSAGTGLLCCLLPDRSNIELNELDERRAQLLRLNYPQAVISQADAAQFQPSTAPTLVLMNPPFSRNSGVEDRTTAARHLKAAIGAASPGARIVAIMPDSFSQAVSRSYHASAIDGTSQLVDARIEQGFTAHGTSVAVRLIVLDKAPGRSLTISGNFQSLDELSDRLTSELPQRMPIGEPVSQITVPVSGSIFGGFERKSPPTPAKRPASIADQTLRYAALTEPRSGAQGSGLYRQYQPSRVSIMDASDHPATLVESEAMASIPAPQPEFTPSIPSSIAKGAVLSKAQLETLIYSGSSWEIDFQRKMSMSEDGQHLIENPEGAYYRRGYFLGDGTGAGKGRQLAAAIYDAWLKGARKAIWISKNQTLLEDARRDWSALGGISSDIQPLSNWKLDEAVGWPEGILFATYPLLRSERAESSRLKQILDWAGSDFEGVIAFDEAHEMGGVAGGEKGAFKQGGSLQGIAGVRLQNGLPRARVIYASATGASNVRNLAYATRLGIWGPGTSFKDRDAFVSEIEGGGIAAMELVSRDLKAIGLYNARSLSFEGVEYDTLRHDLTPEQIAIYDAYADAWAIIHQNLDAALEASGVIDNLTGETLNSRARAAALSRFESVKQRFFQQLLISMKLPSVMAAIDGHLDDGDSVVIQVVTTAESVLDRRLLDDTIESDDDIDLSPREYIVDYLERAFPTNMMAPFADDTGKRRSSQIYDDQGRPVQCASAIRLKAQLIEKVCAMPAMPAALDALIERYGTDKLAEVTGRTKRLLTDDQGQQYVERRSSRTNTAETDAFMSGEKRILVFSDAGGTGRSYHASLDAENQQRRVHFLLEPGWQANKAIQGLGRTHRTHQKQPPLFRPCTTNVKGELRFTSTIARRLDALGALTKGQRQTGGQNLFDPADNLESPYAKKALSSWYRLLGEGALRSVSLDDFIKMTGLKIVDENGCLVESLPPIQRWLNRLLALRIGTQNAIFDEFMGLVERIVDEARAAGTLDQGLETIRVEEARIVDRTVLREDPRTGTLTELLEISTSSPRKPRSLDEALAAGGKLVTNERSGRAAVQVRAATHMTEKGRLVTRSVLLRPDGRDYWADADLAESAWTESSEGSFSRLWMAESDELAATPRTETYHLVTGLLLPIWGTFKGETTIGRIEIPDGSSWLGRLIFADEIPDLLKANNVEKDLDFPTAQDILAMKVNGLRELTSRHYCTLRRSRVNGAVRTEIRDLAHDEFEHMKIIGCYTEIISFRTRLFVPDSVLPEVLVYLETGED